MVYGISIALVLPDTIVHDALVFDTRFVFVVFACLVRYAEFSKLFYLTRFGILIDGTNAEPQIN